MKIAAHTIADIYTPQMIEADLARITTIIPGEASRDVTGLGRFFEASITSAGRYLARADERTAHRMLGVAVDTVAALFLASGHDGPVTFTLEGRPLTGPGGPLHHNANVSMWLDAFGLAAALRRADALDVLARYPEAQLRAAPTGAGDRYRFPLAEGLRRFWRGEPGWSAALDEAEQLSRPEHLRIAPPRLVARYRALIAIVRAIDARDQDAFTTACVEAVKAHKAYYGRGKDAHSPTGLLAYQAAGIAALGVDRGLRFAIDSGYTPGWLIEGRAP